MKAAHMRGRWASSALVVLALVLFAASLSRLGLGVVQVIAAEGQAEPQSEADSDPGDLFEALRAREDRLAEAETALAERQAELRAAEQALARQMTTLEETEARLAETLRLTESVAEEDLQRLTTVFENMRAEQAANMFAQMDTEFAAGFIARLRPDFAGEVMAGLDPLQAYAISAVLAGRHARTPRE